jgi:hypothetical protein
MWHAVLALVIGLAVGNPLLQWVGGVAGIRKVGSGWDPDGANIARTPTTDPDGPTTEAGGQHDPDGSTTEAGSHWDPDG